MSKPNILLKATEVPYGTLVHVYMGAKGPGTMENGEPMVFRRLNGMSQQGMHQIEDGKPTGVMPIEKLVSDVRFSPTESYKPDEAQVGRYVIFKDDKLSFKHFKSGNRLRVEVSKSIDGKLYDASHFPFQGHAACGIPMFESEQKGRYQFSDDDRLLEWIQGEYSDLKSLENGKIRPKTQEAVKHARWNLDEHIEAMRRRHSSDADVINLLKKLNGLYLMEFQLPENAVLVPLVHSVH